MRRRPCPGALVRKRLRDGERVDGLTLRPPYGSVYLMSKQRNSTMRNALCATILGGLMASGVTRPAPGAQTAQENNTVWKISGDLEEACSCRPPCPCWFKSLPSRMTCDGVQAVFIKKGRFGSTALDGLAVAQFVQSPEGKSMFESFGNWNFDNVYIDARATAEQRTALKQIASHLFPAAAKTREYHFVPIDRKIEGDEHIISVGSVGGFSGRLISGGYNGSPKISNAPLADPTHKAFQQGQTGRLTYDQAGQGWKYENSNYMFNQFKVDSKEYEKFESDLARKMAQVQKAGM
jgi:hypothetical protein